MQIDWSTLALQTVNVLVLVWLLARFLFRPVSDHHRRAPCGSREAAGRRCRDSARRRADRRGGDSSSACRGSPPTPNACWPRHAPQAEAERARLLQQATDAAARTRMKRPRSPSRTTALAMERALRADAPATLRSSLQVGCCGGCRPRRLRRHCSKRSPRAIAELPEDDRRNLAAAGGPLEIVTAVPLDERQQTECRDLIDRLLGRSASRGLPDGSSADRRSGTAHAADVDPQQLAGRSGAYRWRIAPGRAACRWIRTLGLNRHAPGWTQSGCVLSSMRSAASSPSVTASR